MSKGEELVAQIRRGLESKNPPAGFSVKFIGVDGRGGSGKSMLAQLLAQELDAEIIQTDDFASNENPLNWWPNVIEKVFEPIKSGATKLNYPRSKWWPDHHPEPVVDQLVKPIMILEGVSATRKEFRPYLAYGIWVESPKEICLQRGVERDKDQGSEAEIKAIWNKWQKKEDEYIARDHPKEYADLIVDGTVDIYG